MEFLLPPLPFLQYDQLNENVDPLGYINSLCGHKRSSSSSSSSFDTDKPSYDTSGTHS